MHDGIILLSVFIAYIIRLVLKRNKFRSLKNGVSNMRIFFDVVMFLASLAILLLSARFVVDIAEQITIDLMFPEILVGLLIVGLGTTLPELSFETNSVRKGFPGMALGDLLGSVVINSSLVLGITTLIYPITANFHSFVIGSAFLIMIFGMFALFTKTGRLIDRKEGFILILFYIIFVLTSIIAR